MAPVGLARITCCCFRLGSRGYVVISPTHADSIAMMKPEERRELKPRDVIVDCGHRREGLAGPRDGHLVRPRLARRPRETPPDLAGKIDRDRIGVGGHSYGAMTATMIAGGRSARSPAAS
jgi:predicted dienelactone hydrolase